MSNVRWWKCIRTKCDRAGQVLTTDQKEWAMNPLHNIRRHSETDFEEVADSTGTPLPAPQQMAGQLGGKIPSRNEVFQRLKAESDAHTQEALHIEQPGGEKTACETRPNWKFWCNKCGYVGETGPLHYGANGQQCGYAAVEVQPIAPAEQPGEQELIPGEQECVCGHSQLYHHNGIKNCRHPGCECLAMRFRVVAPAAETVEKPTITKRHVKVARYIAQLLWAGEPKPSFCQIENVLAKEFPADAGQPMMKLSLDEFLQQTEDYIRKLPDQSASIAILEAKNLQLNSKLTMVKSDIHCKGGYLERISSLESKLLAAEQAVREDFLNFISEKISGQLFSKRKRFFEILQQKVSEQADLREDTLIAWPDVLLSLSRHREFIQPAYDEVFSVPAAQSGEGKTQ